MLHYELRTTAGMAIIAFDNLTRAREYQAATAKRQMHLQLYEVRRVEKLIA